MRRVALALPLVAALTLATAPVAFADEPTPVRVTLPEGATACVGANSVVTTYEVRIERTAGDIQFSDGAVVLINPLVSSPTDVGGVSFQTAGDGTITLPDDWTSQPEGTLSDPDVVEVVLVGVSVGTVPSQDFTIQVEERQPSSQFQDFAGTVDGFDVVDCTPTPTPSPSPAPVTPRPTVPPSDTVATPTGHADLTGFLVVVLGTLAAAALIAVPARRRRRA